MKMMQNETPSSSWLVKDTSASIRQTSIDIDLPLSQENELVMQKLIDFVRFSQDKILNKDEIVRPAVGLAASQIGANINMFYMKIEIYNNEETEIILSFEHALINPKITAYSKEMCYINEGEGCLSVDFDHKGYVPRHYKLTIEGYDYLKKEHVNITVRGYEAIVFQHEYNHLEGKLYYDRINQENPLYSEESWIKI